MTTSSINPLLPPFQSQLTSAPVRSNFVAAYNDINAIWAVIATLSGTGVSLRQVVTPGAITVLITDTGIGVENNSAAPVNVNLLAAAQGRYIVVKDVGGYAGIHNITLVPNGSDTIDGQSQYVIGSAYGAVTIAPITGGYSILA